MIGPSRVIPDVAAVAATLAPDEARQGPWQVVVVGAGPAGAATAIRLARAGLRVLLVDREGQPRGKVCGCCLSVAAVAELGRLGVAGTVLAVDNLMPLERVRVSAGGRATTIPLPGGAVVSRERLDAALVREAIAAGCHWLPGVHVQDVTERLPRAQEGHLRVRATMADGDALELCTGFAVVAAGIADHVRIGGGAAARLDRRIDATSRIGVGATIAATADGLPDGELVMAVADEGYCGIVRLEDGRIDVAAAVDRRVLRRGRPPARAVHDILVAAGSGDLVGDVAALEAAVWRATPALTHQSPLVVGTTGRILRVGDAAGYVEPFTGEGIGWAIAGGRLLADCLATAVDGHHDPAAAAADYERSHARHFSSRHARCRRIARGLRRPAVVAGALAAARLAPWAARRVVPVLIGGGATGSGHR
jgi:flavin-dependent dehydrogenase